MRFVVTITAEDEGDEGHDEVRFSVTHEGNIEETRAIVEEAVRGALRDYPSVAGREEPTAVSLPDGRTASVTTVGNGRLPVLVLPGGPGYAASTMSFDARMLSELYTVYLIDLFGSGGSSDVLTEDEYSAVGHARWYAAVAETMGLTEYAVLGASFGGSVALELAALKSEAVRCVACVSTRVIGVEVEERDGPGGVEENFLQRHASAAWFPVAKAVADNWTDIVLSTEFPALVDQCSALLLPLYCDRPDDPMVREKLDELIANMRVDLRAMKVWESGFYQHSDHRPAAGSITCPTLFVAGERDLLGGPTQARYNSSFVSGSEVQIVSRSGHIPTIENPKDYTEGVMRWFKAHYPPEGSHMLR